MCCFQFNDKELLFFGGKVNKENERQDKVYQFNIDTFEVRVGKERLPCEAEFPQNSQYINGVHYAFGWNEKGLNMLSYSLIKNYWSLVNQVNI